MKEKLISYDERRSIGILNKDTIQDVIMKKVFDEFTQCYPIKKTLRFALIPQGKTEGWVVKNGILDNDEEKSKTYDCVKSIFDSIHKQIIEDVLLNNVDIDFEPLFKAFTEYQSSKDDKQKRKNYQDKQKALQKKISEFFPKFKEINSKMLIENILKGKYSIPQEDVNKVKLFSGFATYFTKYDKTRENIYAADKPTSVAYRIVSDNFPMFYYNYKIIESLPEDILKSIQEQMQDVLKGQTISEIFSPQNYKNVLSQSQITFYNSIIGGVSDNETSKRKGLNEYLNLQFQQGKLTKRIRLKGLYKQILSDSASLSFIPTPYENDADVKNDITVLCDSLMKFDKSVFDEIFKSNDNDDTKIYVDKKQVSVLSQILFDNSWKELGLRLKKKDLYTLSEIKESAQDIDIMKVVCEKAKSEFEEFCNNYENIKEVINDSGKISSYADIKNLLDSIQNIEKTLKIFCASYDKEKDTTFYGLFDEVYEAYRSNIPIYNKVRNYAVKKPYSTEKIKLNFDNPTFVEGWDINKENDYLGVIFTKDEKFYLGIKRKRNLKWEFTEDSKNFCYKMIYKQIPNGAKYFSSKQICSKNSNPPKNIVKYLSKGFDKNQMSKEELSELIDYVINDFIPNYKPLHNENGEPYFNFNFKKPEEYKSWKEFCKDAENQAYRIYFKKVSTECINKAVENGDLYLFEIYNKDFSAKSTGKPNLHTLYWKEVFSEENLKNVVFQLNGGAEVFYRPASIDNPFIHKKGSVLIKKTDRYNKPVDEETYLEAFKDASAGTDISSLSAKYPALLFRTAPYDIIKDKRYSKPSFALHVPIIINYAKDNKYPKFNEAVLNAIKDDEDINIIGIDRGERNLLYISCINRHGEILEQKSLNVINNVDYLSKLIELEKNRDEARKNWKSIAKIKDMKEGFLSLAVHEVTQMMIKYNAIVVLEDLNFGFKRGRFHIERQVYQKFEKMLIDKLNYLADKDKKYEIGGIANAYQIADIFDSFQKLWTAKQSGFLFYLPAAYSSKIDPVTGFVNLFTGNNFAYTNVNNAKALFKKFKNILYNSENDYFEFEFNYSDFGDIKCYKDNWTVCTYGDGRVGGHKDSMGHWVTERINVTEKLKELFKEYDINYKEGDLIKKITSIDEKLFFVRLIGLFKLTVKLRHEDSDDDFILSPIKTEDGFYDSRKYQNMENAPLPVDADANGAYHIALQGLRMLNERIENGKIAADKKGKQNYNWFKFVQEKSFKK